MKEWGKVSIPRGSLHSLKHTFVTNLKRKDVSSGKIQKLARHEDLRTQDIYTHLEVEDLREGIERLDFEGSEPDNGTLGEPLRPPPTASNGEDRDHGNGRIAGTS